MKNATKRIMAMLLVLTMVLGLVPSVFAADMPFTDVPEAEWYAEYVQFVFENNYMIGTSNTEFDPHASCTRAMTATVLWRVDGECPVSGPASFTDLTEDWYANAVAWAERTGVVNGIGDGLFAPDRAVTREELVTMVWRLAGEPKAKGDITAFPDHAEISDYAKTAFAWAIGRKIINGSDGKLLPQQTATRAQFAKIITVFANIGECVEHAWDDGVVATEPTCTENGVKVYTCDNCDLTKEEILPAIGHIFANGVCTNCGEKMAESDELVILFTNDVHTYIDGALSYDNIADLKAQFGKVAADVALVDAGDHIQGTAFGSMDKGNAVIEMMNAAGYDLATLGNHEFDYGMARVLEIVEQADFEYLSANFYHEANGVRGENVLNAAAIVEMGGKKVAFIGITTPETFTKSTPKYFMNEAGEYIYGIAGGEDGTALYENVQAVIDAVKDEADYVIALGHLGDDLSSRPWTSQEVIANVSGLDAFIDGHSHSTVVGELVKDKDGNDVVLAQTGQYFDAIGCMTIKGEEIAVELITEHTGSDATTKEIKDAWIKEVNDQLGVVIGHADVTLDNYDAEGKRLVRKQETNTGDFAADALYYLFNVTEGLKVDAAIMNGGGVRNKAITGDMSYLTCKSIHTFGNVACLITVTGQQILDALEWGARDAGTAKECGGFLHVSGINYEIHTYIEPTVQKDDKGVWVGGPTGEYRVKNVTIGGEALDLSKTYNLAGYNYTLRDLGDGFAMFGGAVNVKDYVMEDYMVLANYLKSFPVDETSGLPTITAENSVYGDVNGAGRIVIKTEKPGVAYVLSGELNDGDQVIIYNPGHGKAIKNETDNDWYLTAQEVAVANDRISTEDTTIVWTVKVNEDGTYSFFNGENAITAWLADNGYVELTNNASYAGGDIKWNIAPSATENMFYVSSATIAGSYGPAYIECYTKTTGDKIAGYSTSKPSDKDFGFQFYVLNGSGIHNHEWDEGVVTTEPACETTGVMTYTCATCGETKTEEIPATGHNYVDGFCVPCGKPAPATKYELVSELKDGDQVIIYNPGHGKAVGNTMNSYFIAGVDVAPNGTLIATADTSIVWTVKANEDGTYTFTNGENEIGADLSGTYVNAFVEAGHNNKWNLQVCNAETSTFYLISTMPAVKYENIYLEWYNAKNGFSAYDTGVAKLTEEAFGFQFYALVKEGDHVHEWDEGVVTTEPTCTENGVKTLTCTTCGETMTKGVPALGHSFDEGTVTTEPTCTTAGVKTFTCGTCGETKTESVPTVDHNYVDNTCTNCGHVKDEEGDIVPIAFADLQDGDIIAIVTTAAPDMTGKDYVLLNNFAADAYSNAAVFDGTFTETMYWTVKIVDGKVYLMNSETTGLYITAANNGMRADGEAMAIEMDASGYLKMTDPKGVDRYIGVYDNNGGDTSKVQTPNFRCYNNYTNNTKNQVTTIYKIG